MNSELKFFRLENRIAKLSNREQNLKSPGVLQKLKRQLRNLKDNQLV